MPPPAHRCKFTIMSDAEYEWKPRPPNLRERIIAGVFVAVLLFTLASEYAGWDLFAGYEKQAIALLILIGLILLRFAPSVHRR